MKIFIENVSKSYGKTVALKSFTAQLEPGIYALLGPNGSGKSTLMNILTDNLKADSGSISFDDGKGNKTDTRKHGNAFREKIGYMPQYPGLYPGFSVRSFMRYIAAVKGLDNKSAEKMINSILREVELDETDTKKIGALSGGMKQRLALAQAVLGSPDILILDEPTAGLDPKQRIAIRNYIAKIALNKIVLIATHVVSDVEYIAKEIILLKKGVIVDKAPPFALTQKIKGKVYEILCSEDDIPSLQDKYRITNISRDEKSGKVILRILSDSPLDNSAVPIHPTLEDYYLYVFGECSLT